MNLATFPLHCKPIWLHVRCRFSLNDRARTATVDAVSSAVDAPNRHATQVPATLLAGRHQNALNWPIRSEDADPGETAVQRTLRINRKRDTMAGHKLIFGPGSPHPSGVLFWEIENGNAAVPVLRCRRHGRRRLHSIGGLDRRGDLLRGPAPVQVRATGRATSELAGHQGQDAGRRHRRLEPSRKLSDERYLTRVSRRGILKNPP